MKPNAASLKHSPRAFPVTSVWRKVRTHSVELSLLLFLWFAYGIAVNSRNQVAFNLQQAGVEAMVERRQFSVDGSASPYLRMRVYYYDGDKPFGDVFLYRGRQYAAKQPGQFMTGAIVYFFLHLFGLNYVNNYLLTSALVSFFTTSLVTAGAAIAVFGIVREFTGGETISWPLASALVYGLGTIAFVYSGIAHHDGLASGYLAIGFYLVVLLARRRTQGRAAKLAAAGCGLLLGLTITTSMLPFLMVCVTGGYLVSLRRWDLTIAALLGGVAGLAPLLIYNAVSFGNPFLPSYIAGGYPESYLHLDLYNSVQKIRFYASEITLYIPVVWVGILGLAFYPRELRRERLVILGLLIAMSIQILNIDSHGGCHYGPRFLLPAMPYACIGLGGFGYLRAKIPKLLAIVATVSAASISVLVSSVGALYGAMYCETQVYALWPGLALLRGGILKDMPLAVWLAVPLLLSVLLLMYSVRNYRYAAAARA